MKPVKILTKTWSEWGEMNESAIRWTKIRRRYYEKSNDDKREQNSQKDF